MVNTIVPLPLLIVFFYFISGGALVRANTQKTWCVANPSASEATLAENINFACSHVDCKVLQNGGPCNSPNSLINHASVAMNLYYQAKGRNQWNCDFQSSGLVSITDPSYGGCSYNI